MKFNFKRVLASVAIAAILIFGVPILINECYKHGGYLTLWSAADVLAYYGTVLGTTVTIGALAITVCFTRRQIQRESYLRSEQERWGKIEERFALMLDLINPMRLIKENINATVQEELDYNITYRLTHMSEMNKLCLTMCGDDLKKVQKLLHLIRAVTDATDTVLKAAFDEQIEGKEYNLKAELNAIYFDIYEPLVQEVVEVFSKINTDIQIEANAMLFLGGNTDANPRMDRKR